MTSGGARLRSGPPPDPNALRREHDKAEWVHLPASGRSGDAPKWPLSRATARERTIWAEEWAKPQAIVWEEAGQERVVALYVRSLVVAEQLDAKVDARNLVKQFMGELGITISGLHGHKWIIDGPEQGIPVRKAARSSSRDRLEVIRGGA